MVTRPQIDKRRAELVLLGGRKFGRVDVKAIDEDAGTITAVVSSEAVDRDGDIIRQAGWNLANFRAHPVLLSSHVYRSLLNQIGEWTSMKVVSKELVGTGLFYRGEGNDEADWAWQLASKGRLAFSVGFMPDMEKAKQLEGSGYVTNYEFRGQELLEVSAVTVPSNPEGLQRMKLFENELDPVIVEIIDAELRDADPPELRGDGFDEDRLVERIVGRLKAELPAELDEYFALDDAVEDAADELDPAIADDTEPEVTDPEAEPAPEPEPAIAAGIDIAAVAKAAAERTLQEVQ